MFDQKETYTNYINSWVGYQMGNTFNLGAPRLWPYPVWLGIGGMDVEMKKGGISNDSSLGEGV